MSAEPSSITSGTSAARPPESKKKSERRRATSLRTRRNVLLRRLVCGALFAVLASGCSIIGKRAADTLSTIVLDQDDPELITSGLPAYLLFADGLISQHPQNVNLLSAGAQLLAVYGSRFPAPGPAGVLTAETTRLGGGAGCHAPTGGGGGG